MAAKSTAVSGARAAALRLGKAGEDRKWRRKPLESLEMDSEMASRRFAVARKDNRSSKLRITLTAAASGSMLAAGQG
jgi:hypothetical protein